MVIRFSYRSGCKLLWTQCDVFSGIMMLWEHQEWLCCISVHRVFVCLCFYDRLFFLLTIIFKKKRFKFPRSLSRGEISLFFFCSLFLILFFSSTAWHPEIDLDKTVCLLAAWVRVGDREREAKARQRMAGRDGSGRTWEKWREVKGKEKQNQSDPWWCTRYPQQAPVKPIRLRPFPL